MADAKIETAMVLAAGFGKRLRPITNSIPKPLVTVGGRTMLDRALDTLVQSGINKAVVNIHYLGKQIKAHCQNRRDIGCVISDETDQILETGGGTVKALPLLGPKPFVLLNADTFWIDFGKSTLDQMVEAFEPKKADILMLVCRPEDATGHTGGVDFAMDEEGNLARTEKDDPNGVIYAGATIYMPAVFDGASTSSHSLNVYYDQAIAKGRLKAVLLENGHWFTVGTPQGLANVEDKLASLRPS